MLVSIGLKLVWKIWRVLTRNWPKYLLRNLWNICNWYVKLGQIKVVNIIIFVSMFIMYCCLVIMQFEEACKEIADEITAPRPEGEETVQDIQIMLTSEANAVPLRELKVRLS